MMADVKRSSDDSGLATGGTTESQTALQHCLDLFGVYLQSLGDILREA
jgi:hypothetical protein